MKERDRMPVLALYENRIARACPESLCQRLLRSSILDCLMVDSFTPAQNFQLRSR
jgi:hypothetical protein